MAISPVSAAPSPAVPVAELPLAFSAHVADKTYQGSVVREGDMYVAENSQVLGARATAGSLQAAEQALAVRIDCLV